MKSEVTERLDRNASKFKRNILIGLLILSLCLIGFFIFKFYSNRLTPEVTFNESLIEKYGREPQNVKSLFGDSNVECCWFVQNENITAYITPSEYQQSYGTNELIKVHYIKNGQEYLVDIPFANSSSVIPISLYILNDQLYLTYSDSLNINKMTFIGIYVLNESNNSFSSFYNETKQDLGEVEDLDINVNVVPPVLKDGIFYFLYDYYCLTDSQDVTSRYVALCKIDNYGNSSQVFTNDWYTGSGVDTLFGPLAFHTTVCFIPYEEHFYLSGEFYLLDIDLENETMTTLLDTKVYGDSNPISKPKSLLIQDDHFYYENFGKIGTATIEGKDVDTILELWPGSLDSSYGSVGAPYLINHNNIYYSPDFGGKIKSYNLQNQEISDFVEIESIDQEQEQKIFDINEGIDGIYVMLVYGDKKEALQSWNKSQLVKISFDGKSVETIYSN